MTFFSALPVQPGRLVLGTKRVGLLHVDPVKGFAGVGCGPLAPRVENAQVSRMIGEMDRFSREFLKEGRPVATFLDTHQPGKPEEPYPPHCETGTGQEDLVEALAWMSTAPGVTLIRKDCINGFVGSIDLASGRNRITDWITAEGLDTLVVMGICTDICVLQFVQTLLSARNHGMTGALKDIVVYEPGCATYDLPLETARALGLPDTAAHPQEIAHHVGLYLMAASGALVVNEIAS